MKRLLLLITICISSVSFGQYTSIPDPNFEQALIDLGHDDVIDGQVLTSNVSSVYYLDLSNKNISDLTGINDFQLLTYLYLNNNDITSLNINITPFLGLNSCQLKELSINGNPVNSLILQNTENLELLNVRGTYLSQLDVYNYPYLSSLDISYTAIESIDLSSNLFLRDLGFGGEFINSSGDWQLSPMNSIEIISYEGMDISYYGGLLVNLDLSNVLGYSDISIDCNVLQCINLANGTNGNWDGSFLWGDVYGSLGYNADYGLPPPPPLCIQVDDVNIANTLWVGNFDVEHPDYTFSTDCGDCSGTSNLTELNSNQPKELIKIVNLLGQEVEYTPNTVLIYQYSDGTSEKVFTIED